MHWRRRDKNNKPNSPHRCLSFLLFCGHFLWYVWCDHFRNDSQNKKSTKGWRALFPFLFTQHNVNKIPRERKWNI
jgi:hypothetical protein